MSGISNSNLINKPLWDKAGWKWSAFLVTEDLDSQPGIGLMFEDFQAGIQIFTEWQSLFGGSADRSELLRIGIVEGNHPTKGNGYSITFGTDITSLPQGGTGGYHAAGIRWRFHDTRGSNQSLEWFKASLKRHGMFFLVPMPPKPEPDVSIYFPHMIGKTRVYLSDYVSVTSQDQDGVVLNP